MSLERLIKQLGKEARRSPKKAAALGVLTLVALWFWAPLVWGWLRPEQPPEVAVAAQAGMTAPVSASEQGASGVATPPAASADASPTKTPPGQPKPADRPDWRQVVEWMEIDPFSQPAELPQDLRDPFARKTEPEPLVAVETEGGPEPEEEAPVVMDPASLGLVLSSTIVGPQRRAARINGKTYRAGEKLIVNKDGRQYEFVLAEIHPRYVVLSDGTARFELSLPKPDLSDAIRPYRAAGRN